MKVSSEIVKLQEEIKQLKASQILGGDNSRVYRYFIGENSVTLYKKGNYYIRKSDYDDPSYTPIPGSAYTVTSLIYPLEDDPFALVEVEKIEVWRNGHLLTWSNYTYDTNTIGGQKSQYGDSMIIRYTKSGNGYSSDATPRLGTTVRLEMCAPSNLSDNPGSTIQYTFKVWLKSTSIYEYGFIPDYTGGY